MKRKIRSMRDIPTIQGLRNRSVPTTQEQAVTELARLEHEKARLERELNIWIENQKRTEGRLRQVEERIALLKPVLDYGSRGSGEQRTADDGRKDKDWRKITLEY